MHLLRKVSPLEIKRCFVVGNLCAKRSHRGHMKKFESEQEYLKRLAVVKAKVVTMKEKELDSIIGGEYQKRLDSYNNSIWHEAEMSPSELGVWRRAGELPLRWTNRSLAETADKVRRALRRKNGFRNKNCRAKHAIPGILNTCINIVQKEKYLLPIVFKCDTGTGGRRLLKRKMVGDIDDGCMRSIALTVSGAQRIKVYFGQPRH